MYCGKDIDAFEPPRDSEFRFPAHRKYEERLRETLDRVAAPEPSPAASDSWMPNPAVEAVAREARLSMAYALCGNAAPKPAVLEPFRVAVAPAEPQVEAVAAPGMPEPGFIPPDFHCENVRGAAVDRLEWQAPNMAPVGPRFALRPAFDRLEELVPRKAAPKSSRPGGAATHRGVEAIAAGLFVAAGMWYGAGAAKNLVETAAMSQGISAAAGAAPARTNPAPQTDIKKQPLSWVRSTISRRAAVELTDTFHGGMEFWNAAPQRCRAIPTDMSAQANWLSTVLRRSTPITGWNSSPKSRARAWVGWCARAICRITTP